MLATTRLRPILDELARLETQLPDIPGDQERHAALLERLPPLLDLRGRALVHAQQYERFLTLAGVPATIHFGVDRTSIGKAKLAAHCWVSADDMPVLNPPEPTMVTIFTEKNRVGTA